MGPNPRGKGQGATLAALATFPPPFRAVSAKVRNGPRISAHFRAFQPDGGRLGQLVTPRRHTLSHLGGGSSAASGSIFLPRKAAGDCGQVGGRRRQLTTDQGFAARQPFLRLCQREG